MNMLFAAICLLLLELMLKQPDIDSGDFKAISAPSLVIGGENDIFKPGTFKNIVAALPDPRLKIMKGHDHDSCISHTDILYPGIMEFFKS